MAESLGTTTRTIRRHLKFLIEEEYIYRSGSDKIGKWEINYGLLEKK